MPNTEDRGEVPNSKQPDAEIKAPLESAGEHNERAKASNQNPAQKEEAANTKFEQDLRSGERWLIRIGIAALVVNTIIALIYWGQLIQMRKATNAATNSANASLSAAITAIQQARDAGEANWLTRSSAINSQEQSRAALNASIEEFHLGQRAWVGLVAVNGRDYRNAKGMAVYIKAGQIVRLGADLTNSGKTIAKRATFCVNLKFVSRGIGFVPKGSDCQAPIVSSAAVIMPGMKVTVWTRKIDTLRATPALITAIQSGNVRLYFFGWAEYRDVFGGTHFFKFCTVMSRDMSAFGSIGSYNDAN
ncbi:MAG: hypothetical protein ACRD19_14705 [Terriglobia bacterium]